MRPTMPGRMYVVVGRFRPAERPRYRAATMPNAPTRLTFAAAERDELEWRDARGFETAPPCEPGDAMCVDGWPCPIHDYPTDGDC